VGELREWRRRAAGSMQAGRAAEEKTVEKNSFNGKFHPAHLGWQHRLLWTK
jgi:hypothetical protein